jgi:dystonin
VSATSRSLVQTIAAVASRWSAVTRKATERRTRLETALAEATEFHSRLQSFIAWLTDTEKELNMNKPVAKILANVNAQIGDHQVMQKNITEHRAKMLALDTLGYQLKYHSQKQDVILVKNVLISVQNRWEKIVSRSAERTRDLERGYKEAKLFADSWTELSEWLSGHLELLGREQEVGLGDNPLKIKQCIGKHREFHRELSGKQASYDVVMRLGRKLVDR